MLLAVAQWGGVGAQPPVGGANANCSLLAVPEGADPVAAWWNTSAQHGLLWWDAATDSVNLLTYGMQAVTPVFPSIDHIIPPSNHTCVGVTPPPWEVGSEDGVVAGNGTRLLLRRHAGSLADGAAVTWSVTAATGVVDGAVGGGTQPPANGSTQLVRTAGAVPPGVFHSNAMLWIPERRQVSVRLRGCAPSNRCAPPRCNGWVAAAPVCCSAGRACALTPGQPA
jgi:hypothetical protein